MVVVAAVALVLAGVAMPVGSAGATNGESGPSTAAPPESPTNATLAVHVEREGSTIRYHATVRAPEGADRVRLDGAFGMLNVTAGEGFVAAGSGYRLRDGRERATLTASLDLSAAQDTPLGRVGPDGPFQATEDWAFAPSPRYHVRWWHDGELSSTNIRDAGARDGATESVVDADAPVAVGERFVFLGPHEMRTAQVDGQTVRLVVPDAASFDVGTERSVELARTVQQETGTTPDRTVTAFVLPRTVRAGGSASGTDLWLRADVSELTVAHEFAHTALDLSTTGETRWLSEAAAEYLAYRASQDRGVTETLRGQVTDGDAMLADRETWESSHVAYRKGAALLAVLDDRIRTATDGDATLAAVLRRLSTAEATIDAAAVREAVSAVADDRTATWLDEQATSTAPAALPENQASGVGSMDGLLPGGILWAGAPISLGQLAALIAVVGALSMLLWVPLRIGYRLLRRLSARVSAT